MSLCVASQLNPLVVLNMVRPVLSGQVIHHEAEARGASCGNRASYLSFVAHSSDL